MSFVRFEVNHDSPCQPSTSPYKPIYAILVGSALIGPHNVYICIISFDAQEPHHRREGERESVLVCN